MIYKGYELIKAIEDEKIKEGTEFYDRWGNEYVYSKAKKALTLKNLDNIIPDYELFINNEFEVIESEKETDNTELLTIKDYETYFEKKINEFLNEIRKEINKCK